MEKKTKVNYELNSGEITSLEEDDIEVILRAADEIVLTAGRSLLVKVLKGSGDKKVLEHKLGQCPSYGCYRALTTKEIGKRIDFMIVKNYLKIEYINGRPLLAFADKAWRVKQEMDTGEWYQRFSATITSAIVPIDMFEELQVANRQVIFALLEKIRENGNAQYIPLLRIWQSGEVQEVKERIEGVITILSQERFVPLLV